MKCALMAGVALIAFSTTAEAATTRIHDASATYSSDCDYWYVSASRVSSRYVQLSYQVQNRCAGEILASGSGSVPASALNGSYDTGKLTLGVDVSAVKGYAWQGTPLRGTLTWTKTSDWRHDLITNGVDIDNTKTPRLSKSWRRVEKTQSATIAGAVNLGPTPFNGSIGYRETTE